MPDGVCLVETRTPVHDVTVEGLAEAVSKWSEQHWSSRPPKST